MSDHDEQLARLERADEYRWRAVKDRSGYYVHGADTHVYPGPGMWGEERCALRADVGCNAKSDPPAEAGGSRAARGPEPTD